jgi:hypothetical protein
VRQEPLPDDSTFSFTPWNEEGVATLEAAGPDPRSAMQAALGAALTITLPDIDALDGSEDLRSVPIHAEGDDLAALFAGLLEALLAEIEHYGTGLRGITLDGLLRRDRGGYVAWGYADATSSAGRLVTPPRLLGQPTVIAETPERVVLHASLSREQPPRGGQASASGR